MADRQSKASNRFEQRANLYLSMADAQAQRIADGWNEQPADSTRLGPDQLRQLWAYSPSQQPEADFWAMHDQLLQQALLQADPSKPEQIDMAHHQAETKALEAIYPYRAQLAGIGTAQIDEQVKRAEHVQRLVAQEDTQHAA